MPRSLLADFAVILRRCCSGSRSHASRTAAFTVASLADPVDGFRNMGLQYDRFGRVRRLACLQQLKNGL